MIIELMLSLLIAMIMLSALSVVYTSAINTTDRGTNTHLEKMHVIEAAELIAGEVAQAGFVGCQRVSRYFHVDDYSSYKFTFENRLEMTNHSIISRHASKAFAIIRFANNQSRVIHTSEGLRFENYKLYIVSDCAHAQIVEVSAIRRAGAGYQLTLTESLHYPFREDAEIARYYINQLYVSKYHHNKSNSGMGSGLYVKDVSGHARILVDHIDQINVNGIYSKNILHGINYQILTHSGIRDRVRSGYAVLQN